MRESKGVATRRRAMLIVHVCMMVAVLLVICGCNDQLTRMEENQVKLQAMVAANARELATLSSQVHTGQGKLTDGLQNLDAQTQAIAGTTHALQSDQRQLHETVVAGNQELEARATALREDQQALRARVAQVQDVTARTATDLTTLARQHTALHDTVQANQRELNDHMAAVASNQQGIQGGVARLQQADEGLARDLASVADKQDAHAAALHDIDERTAELLTALSTGHDRLSADLLNMRALMQTVATDVTGLADEQTTLHAALQNGTQTLTDKLTILERNQTNHQAGIDRASSTVNQTAAVIATMAAAQTAMEESLADNQDDLTARIAGLSVTQQTLQAGIDTLSDKADRAAADSAAAASSLHDAMRVNREVLTGQMAVSLRNQQAIQGDVDTLSDKADGLATTLAAVSSEQAAARETAKTDQQAIIAAASGLADEHRVLRAGVEQIDGKADRIGSELTAVAAGQSEMRKDAMDNHEGVVARLGSLSKSQAELHGRLSTLDDKADATISELAAAARKQETMQQSLADVGQAVASRTTALAENQQNLKAGLADLDTRTQRVSTDLAAASAAQDNFRLMQQSHNQATDARTAALTDGQQVIRNQLDTLTATTGQTALSVLTMNNGQASFQQAMQTGMNGLHEKANQTADDIHGMAHRQTAFQESIKAGNETLTAQTAAIIEGHQALKADLDRTSKIIDRAYADLTAVSLAQDALQTSFANRSDEITSRAARIEGNQKALAGNLDVLTATAGQTAIDVLALADGQSDLQRGIKTGNDAVIARTTTLSENQNALGSHLDVLTATSGQTAIDVLAVSRDQARLTRTLDSGLANLNERTDRLAADQQKTQAGVDMLTATAGQTALDVITVGNRQDALRKTLLNQSDLTSNQIAALADSQQKAQSSLDTLTATTGQTARDVTAVANRQEALQSTVRSHNQSAIDRMTSLADNQQKIQSGVDTLTATTGQTALDVITVADRQDTLRNAIQSQRDSAATQMATLAANHLKMQSAMDTLTTTTGQTALDVIEMAQLQDAMQTTLRGHGESADARLVMLAGNQERMQNGLDSIAATTGQASQGILALSEAQARSEQATKTGHVDVTDKLAQITQDQQSWQQRFDATQTRMQAMTEVIVALDRQLGDLRGILQTGLRDNAALVDTDTLQRQQFEVRIAQDVQTMMQAIEYLRATQAQLQEQMSRVQQNTQVQADALKAAIEQMKQASAQVKVSDAGRRADAVMVQTGE